MRLAGALVALFSFSSLTSALDDYAQTPSWEVEGFAKENPIGLTTGGKGGPTVTVSSAAALKTAVAGDAPKIVHIAGEIVLPSRLKVGSNKSLIGVGTTAHITGSGIDVVNGTNVIIQNLRISFITDNDCITIRNSTRVWVDHNEFHSDIEHGPDAYDGQVDIIRASDWITVSWNYFHDHWKSSLVGNDDTFRDIDSGHLHITYHHNYWRNEGTRGPAGRFGHQHVYNNLYVDFRYQALHSRSDNQMLVEGNVFRGQTREALSTYGLVIPDDSPNTCVCGDEELDGFANLGAANDWGNATVNITQVGTFTKAPYKYKLTQLEEVEELVKAGAGIGKV
ncbi:polysaccharide lyase family 1 protein [Schizothecium vesticola]|uniref:Polysaccharide lyase family 1 protein n=1 Tax=Schizothecium vesticola TaxID=314040 RepID=A0AA40F2Z6_9PEZI|nr:polysaccharide lyase family 1 protein [Schizothecium vesticola]